jgi:hypothetical protein
MDAAPVVPALAYAMPAVEATQGRIFPAQGRVSPRLALKIRIQQAIFQLIALDAGPIPSLVLEPLRASATQDFTLPVTAAPNAQPTPTLSPGRPPAPATTDTIPPEARVSCVLRARSVRPIP